MVHGIESVSAESTPKMEALLNRAARHGSPILANHYTTKAKPYIKPTEDYVNYTHICIHSSPHDMYLGYGY